MVTVEAMVRVSQDYKNAKPQNWGICNGEEMRSRATRKKKKNKEQLGLGGVLILHEDAAITTVYQILGMAI